MRRLLIADMSEASLSLLVEAFRKEYKISVCRSGDALADALRTFRPDAMILDLAMPGLDGLEARRRSRALLPPVILAITVSNLDYVVYNAMELGVGHMIIRPFTIRAVREHLAKMVWLAEHTEYRAVSPQDITLRHLEALGFRPGNEGFQMLRVGIPILAQDLGMSLSKELYPAIMEKADSDSWKNVEHNIRFAIKDAWLRRDPDLWLSYFPQCQGHSPTNSEFLGKLAIMVETELDRQIRIRPLPPEEQLPSETSSATTGI